MNSVQIDAKKFEDALDFILEQQLFSPTYRIVNRTKQNSMLMAGSKAVLGKLRILFMLGFSPSVLAGNTDNYVEFLSQKFHVPKELFTSRLGFIDQHGVQIDPLIKFTQIISMVREHWQDIVYEEVLDDIKVMVAGRNRDYSGLSRDMLNKILSSQCGPNFSMLINLYTIRLWSKITGEKIKFRNARIKILNRLVGQVVNILKNDGTYLQAGMIK